MEEACILISLSGLYRGTAEVRASYCGVIRNDLSAQPSLWQLGCLLSSYPFLTLSPITSFGPNNALAARPSVTVSHRRVTTSTITAALSDRRIL